jgi:hypothetical protein
MTSILLRLAHVWRAGGITAGITRAEAVIDGLKIVAGGVSLAAEEWTWLAALTIIEIGLIVAHVIHKRRHSAHGKESPHVPAPR